MKKMQSILKVILALVLLMFVSGALHSTQCDKLLISTETSSYEVAELACLDSLLAHWLLVDNFDFSQALSKPRLPLILKQSVRGLQVNDSPIYAYISDTSPPA